MHVDLYPHQAEALRNMKNGCILAGGVGSGKSITALTYFYVHVMKGKLKLNGVGEPGPFRNTSIDKLLIITPAKKKRDLEWDHEAARFGLSRDREKSFGGIQVIVDSWQNVSKYTDIQKAFVIFDEQKLVGNGVWVKSFHRIAKSNPWIVLSATPGDNWMDLVSIFIAHGFFKNRTEFANNHVVYSRYSKFPKVERYVHEDHLEALRSSILVDMPFHRHTIRNIHSEWVDYDRKLYERVQKDRWDIWLDEPFQNAAAWIQGLRRVTNTHPSRLGTLSRVISERRRVIVFYTFNYELELLRAYLKTMKVEFSEWNGQKHQPVPEGDEWVYLVQYTSGNDGWNCITTDTIIFYSLQYSYKVHEQCQGRIDRLNTPYKDLHYYILRSQAKIDLMIWKAILGKKNFSDKGFSKDFE